MRKVLNLPRFSLVLGVTVLVMWIALACGDDAVDRDLSVVRDSSCQRLCDSGFWRSVLVPAEVRAELDRGASVDATTKLGFGGGTPLHFAVAHNNEPTVVEVLLNRGADVNAKDNLGDTPLHWAAAESERPAIIALLLAWGADINSKGNNGWTPLHDASARRPSNVASAVITLLVDRGGDIHARNDSGDTACEVGVFPHRLLCPNLP